MGLQLEGDGLAVADVSMHTDLERAVLHAALQFHVDILTAGRAQNRSSWKMQPQQQASLSAVLSSSQHVKAQYACLQLSTLACNSFDGGFEGKAHALLQLDAGLSQLLKDDEANWRRLSRIVHPYLLHEVKQWVSKCNVSTAGKADCHELLQELQRMQHALSDH